MLVKSYLYLNICLTIAWKKVTWMCVNFQNIYVDTLTQMLHSQFLKAKQLWLLSTLKIIEQILIFFLSIVSRIQLLNCYSDSAAGFFHNLEHWDWSRSSEYLFIRKDGKWPNWICGRRVCFSLQDCKWIPARDRYNSIELHVARNILHSLSRAFIFG